MIHVVGLFKKITIIAKRELLYFQPVGGLAWLAGICFLNRRNPTTSKASMDQALANIKKNKVCGLCLIAQIVVDQALVKEKKVCKLSSIPKIVLSWTKRWQWSRKSRCV